MVSIAETSVPDPSPAAYTDSFANTPSAPMGSCNYTGNWADSTTWDDALRLAGSLKLGVVQATSVMRTLRVDDRPTKLAQAVAELGRIDKSIHSLMYIDDESKRRRTLTQLNRQEDRHKLARAVFHGKRGELRQRYREGQEDQLGALGLVVNIIVLWNTLYMDAAFQQLRAEGFPVHAEDIARLSPLVFEHINLLGGMLFQCRKRFSAENYGLSGVHPIQSRRSPDSLSEFSVPLLPITQLHCLRCSLHRSSGAYGRRLIYEPCKIEQRSPRESHPICARLSLSLLKTWLNRR
jgi:hypothetical protein